MNKEEARRIIDSTEYWHYEFDLPWRKTVPTKPGWATRTKRRREHFFQPLLNRYRGSLKGKAVLDLGCCQGYWSFEAKKADAASTLGIDSSPYFVEEAKAVAAVLEYDCKFQVSQLEEEPWWQRMPEKDITLMLGVFFHLTDPILVLRKAMQLTRETIVIDTEVTFGSETRLDLRPRCPTEPTTVRSNPSSSLRMVPTISAVLALLKDGGFKEIAVLDPKDAPDDYKNGITASFIASR